MISAVKVARTSDRAFNLEPESGYWWATPEGRCIGSGVPLRTMFELGADEYSRDEMLRLIGTEWGGFDLLVGGQVVLTGKQTAALAERRGSGDEPCEVCDGLGGRECATCDGVGECGHCGAECGDCEGSGTAECPECAGAGWITPEAVSA